MPIFRLTRRILFPPPHLAEPDGLLAVGGDLSGARLLEAYRHGIFPWYSQGQPILWWSPDPRFVLFTAEAHVSHSMARVLRRGNFSIECDRDFAAVIHACAAVERRGEDGTWITPAMERAYTRLHREGFAHSVEVRRQGKLVGGLYGVAVGRIFCGESMFSLETNASKAALLFLAERLHRCGWPLIDCQFATDHLRSLGGRPLPRGEYLAHLRGLVLAPPDPTPWAERS